MTSSIDELIDQLVPASSMSAADWDEVVARAGSTVAAAEPGRAKFRWAFRASLAAGVAAVSLVGLSVVGGGESCTGVLECAAAAINGEGPVAHLVFGVPNSEGGLNTWDSWYDAHSGVQYSKVTLDSGETFEMWLSPSGNYSREDGRVTKLRDDAESIDAPVGNLYGRYEQELKAGNATFGGEMTFGGEDAYAIDFPLHEPVNPVTGEKSRVMQRVVLDRDTYQPLAYALVSEGRLIPRRDSKTLEPLYTYTRILSAEFEQRDPAMFDLPPSRSK